MTATKQNIEIWLQHGLQSGSTHVIVVCDTYSHDNYPIYVRPDEEIKERMAYYSRKNMQRIDEVYNMRIDLDEQLEEYRAWNV